MDAANHQLREWFFDLLTRWGLSEHTADKLDGWLVLLSIVILVLSINFFMRLGVIRLVHWFVHRTKVTWDDIIFDDKVLRSLTNILMPLIVRAALPSIIVALDITGGWIQRALFSIVGIWTVIVGLLFVNAILKAVYSLLEQRPGLQGKPIKGLLQTCQVILIIIGIILIVSILINKSPALLLTGLGASAAVISFIFKDSLMGLVAGVQLSANNMLKVGDWITMPQRGIDGMVVEVALTTIKVRGWNNTLQTLPPYLLISEPFDNWQAMRDTGGRRIKRSLNVDMNSIRFADEAYIGQLRSNEQSRALIEDIATQSDEGETLTNLDLFMRAMNNYLLHHPRVNPNMTVMVRQLQPSEWGLPIEVYCFSADVNWVPYENLQTEIISYVVAAAPLFGLRMYQAPSGMDLRA